MLILTLHYTSFGQGNLSSEKKQAWKAVFDHRSYLAKKNEELSIQKIALQREVNALREAVKISNDNDSLNEQRLSLLTARIQLLDKETAALHKKLNRANRRVKISVALVPIGYGLGWYHSRKSGR
jgi:hypothetical protein